MIFSKVQIGLAIAVVVAIVGITYLAYDGIKERGKAEAAQECAQKFADYTRELQGKVTTMEAVLTSLASNSNVQQEVLVSDVSEILNRIKRAPVTVIKNGKCTPSPTFVEGINEAISRVNSR
jgi:uncharacterized membrane protein YfbV (UPF0208 family)